MNGLIAIHGDQIHFCTSLVKNNDLLTIRSLADYRVINGTVFLPIRAHSAVVHEWIHQPSLMERPYQQFVNLGGICGLLINQHEEVYEVSHSSSDIITMRPVSIGPTQIYTRADDKEIEDIALVMIDRFGLEEGIKQAYLTTNTMMRDPIITNLHTIAALCLTAEDLTGIKTPPKALAAAGKQPALHISAADLQRAIKGFEDELDKRTDKPLGPRGYRPPV